MRKVLFWILLATSLMACHPHQSVPQNPLVKIEFGAGGGFTGAVNVNTLSADRTLTRTDQSAYAVSPSAFDSIASLSEQIHSPYRRPQNTYLFVNIYRRNDTLYNAWTSDDKKVNQKLVQLYNQLTRL